MNSSIAVTLDWSPQFLVVRHPTYQRHFFDVVLEWVRHFFPELRMLFDVRDLPTSADDWSGYLQADWTRYMLHVPWLQDPVQQWSPAAYERAGTIAARCDELGIPVVNRVDRLLNATKSIGARLMSQAGVPTPRMAAIRDADEFRETLLGLNLPLFVREDWGHAGEIRRVDTLAEARVLPLDGFARPVAVELIDVRDPRDGLYRKYRYVAAGDLGVSHHLQVSADWITRGDNRVVNDVTRNEELAYIGRPDVNHDILQCARRAMQLEFVAFDYGYSPDGKLVVWEANPFPWIQFSTQALTYRNAALHRTMLAMLNMYLELACLPVPERIVSGIAY